MRMMQKPFSFVLAALKPSTYLEPYASGFRLLRPCWQGFFIILFAPRLGLES